MCLRLLPELRTYKIVRRLIIRLKMVIVIIYLIRDSNRSNQPVFFHERNGTSIFQTCESGKKPEWKRNVNSFRGTFSISRNLQLVVVVVVVRCDEHSYNFPFTASIDVCSSTFGDRPRGRFVFPSRLEFALKQRVTRNPLF